MVTRKCHYPQVFHWRSRRSWGASPGVHRMATGRTSSARWMPFLVVSLTLLASAASAQQAGLRSPATPAKAAAASKAAAPGVGSARTLFIVGRERAAEARDVKISALVNPNRILIDLPQMRLDLPN